MHYTKQKTLQFKPLQEINLDEIPEPLTWHTLVQPLTLEDKTTGGLYISEQDNEEYTKLHCVGKVLKMGDICFKTDTYKNTQPYSVGDYIFFGRHNGMWFDWGGHTLVLLADDRIPMKFDPALLEHFDGFQKHKEGFEQ